MVDQLPPHASEAERSILGSIIDSDQDLLSDLSGSFDREMFYDLRHREIWDHLVGLQQAGRSTSFVMLVESLRASGQLEAVGGVDYLLSCVGDAMSRPQMMELSTVVREKWLLRRFIQASIASVAEAQTNPTLDVPEFLATASGEIARLASGHLEDDEEDSGQLIDAYLDYCEKGESPERFRTGLVDLDAMCRLRPGDVMIIGARPSVGKTALSLTIALNMALAGIPVGFVSLEMSPDQMRFRLISLASDVRFSLIEDPASIETMDQREVARIHQAVDRIRRSNLRISCRKNQRADQIVSRLRRWKSRFGTRVAVIDYIQLVSLGRQKRYEGVTEASQAFKNIAGELGMCLIVLSQINRDAEDAEARPKLTELKESGALEQDADQVLLIHRSKEKPGRIHAHLDKQRNGPIGSLSLTFDGPTMRFRDESTDGY